MLALDIIRLHMRYRLRKLETPRMPKSRFPYVRLLQPLADADARAREECTGEGIITDEAAVQRQLLQGSGGGYFPLSGLGDRVTGSVLCAAC